MQGKQINIGLSLLITICTMLVTGVGTYFTSKYSAQNELNLVKANLEVQIGRIDELKEDVESYSDLPGKMETLQKTTDETKLIVGVIRDGLIAKGIIKPSN